MYYFSLNHVIISHLLVYILGFINIIAFNYDEYKNYLFFLIPTVFQIISLLFFLEILEFNFCNFNKNTKRNIMLREKSEMKSEFSSMSEIEIDNDLIIKAPQDIDTVELYDFDKIDDNNLN